MNHYENNHNENSHNHNENSHNNNKAETTPIVSYAEGYLDGLNQGHHQSQGTITAIKNQMEAATARNEQILAAHAAQATLNEKIAELDASIHLFESMAPFLEMLRQYDPSSQKCIETTALMNQGLGAMKERRNNLLEQHSSQPSPRMVPKQHNPNENVRDVFLVEIEIPCE